MLDAALVLVTLSGSPGPAATSSMIEMQARRLTPTQARAQCWREAGFDPRQLRGSRSFPRHLLPQIDACARRKLGR
jgi:hypothetical protein